MAPTLLIVLPGASGRAPVIKRIQTFANVCVLVPSSDMARSAWAKPVVGENNWIEWEGTLTSVETAFTELQAWLSAEDSRCIDGVMTYDDFGLELCAHLCDRLGLPGTPSKAACGFKDKIEFRKRCAEVGLYTPQHRRVLDSDDVEAILSDKTVRFPAVLKPAKGGGSWHIQKINTASELKDAWDHLSHGMSSKGGFPTEIKEAGFTLEEYFQGDEIDVDGWARNGTVEFCMVSDNRPAIEPHFLEAGGIYPSQLPLVAIEKLKALTSQVVAAFPGVHSCFHFEAKINMETLEVMPIEFNARVGGAECPASVEAVTGYYLPTVAACLALNLPASAGTKTHDVVASTNLHRFETGILTECSDSIDMNALKVVTKTLFNNGLPRAFVPNNGSMSCLGWIATGGDSAEEAELNLQEAISQTKITIVQPNGVDKDQIEAIKQNKKINASDRSTTDSDS